MPHPLDYLFQLLDTPGTAPDAIANEAVSVFASAIMEIIPQGFTGPVRGAGIIDLRHYHPQAWEASIHVHFATEEQIERVATETGFTEILDEVRAIDPRLETLFVVMMRSALSILKVSKETSKETPTA
jgi:hypothetical protein